MNVSWLRRLFWVFLALGADLAHAQSYSPKPLSEAQPIDFDSESCLGYWTPDYRCQPIKIRAHLFTPKSDWSALVVVSHGAQGVDQRVFEYADALTQSGMAALVIDHWTPRGIQMRTMNYSQATERGGTTSSMATDALWAVAHARQHLPQAKRFAFLGESMGGIAAIHLIKQRTTDLFARKSAPEPFAIPFAALVGLYPACVERVVGERFVNTPFLILSGELDDHTPPQLCQDYQQWVNARGGRLRADVVPGAHHDFDAPHPLTFRPRGQNLSKCLYTLQDDTITLAATGKVLPNTLAGQAQLPRECATWGLRSGHGANKFVAVPQWLAFLQQHLN